MKIEKNPYEVSPDDIKSPKKTLWAIIGISVAAVVIVVAIFLPLYFDRMNHRDAMSASISQVFTVIKPHYDLKTGSDYGGFSFRGQKNDTLLVSTDDAVTPSEARTTFENYAKLWATLYAASPSDYSACYGDIKLTVYAANGSFDESGNRATQTLVLGTDTTITTYTYDSLNRLTGTEEKLNGIVAETVLYTYDNNGSQLSKTSTAYIDGIPQTPVTDLTADQVKPISN